MAVKKTIIIEADTKKAVDNIEDVNDALEDTTEAQEDTAKGFSIMQTSAGKFFTSAVAGFKGVIAGLRTTIASMGVLKVAIAATGIGALVIAFGTLTSFFTKTQRGADLVDQVFKTIGATVDVLVDRLSTFGEGLFQIASGKFKQGFETLSGSIKGVGDEIREESKAAQQLEKDFQKLQDREIEFIKVQAQKRRAIEQARLAAEDESKTDEERADALREAIRIQNELTDEQIAIEKERARIIRERVALGESTREDIEEQARAEARVIELETERDRRLRSVQTRLNAFTKGVKDNTKAEAANAKAKERAEAAAQKAQEAKEKEAEAIRKANEEREKEIQQLIRQSELSTLQAQQDALLKADALEEEFLNRSLSRQEKEKNAIRDKYFASIEAQKEAGMETLTLENALQTELDAVDEKYAKIEMQREEQMKQAKLAIASSALGAIGQLFGQQSAAGKAASIAQATINTYQAATNALANTPLPPPFPQIAAGVTIAAGLAQVKRIASTKIPNGFGGSGSGGGVSAPSIPSGIGAPQVPTVQFNTLQGGFNQLEGAINNRNNEPVQAYVTTQQINNANQLNRKVVGQSNFG